MLSYSHGCFSGDCCFGDERLGWKCRLGRWASSLWRPQGVTRIKAYWGAPFIGGEGPERQESQEAEKSRSPESGNFPGWEIDRVKYKSRPAQLELDICIGWGAMPRALREPHEDNSALDDQVPDSWWGLDSGLPAGIFYWISFIPVRDWLLWPDLFVVPIISATCSHFPSYVIKA